MHTAASSQAVSTRLPLRAQRARWLQMTMGITANASAPTWLIFTKWITFMWLPLSMDSSTVWVQP